MFTRKHMQGINLETREWTILHSRVTKLSRGAVAVAAAKEKAEYNLLELTLSSKRRAARQKKDGRHIQTGGTIYIRDARLRLAAKDSI